MNKIWVLYRNEMYKLFRTRKMLILLAVLLLVPFLGMAFSSPSYDDGRYNTNKIFTYEEMHDIHVESLEMLAAGSREMAQYPGYESLDLAVHAQEQAQVRFDELWADDQSFAARSYIPEVLTAAELSRVMLDPAGQGYTGSVAEDVFDRPQDLAVIRDHARHSPVTREQAEELVAAADAAIADKTIEAYASFALTALDHRAENETRYDPRLEAGSEERSYYEGILAGGTMSELELYNPDYSERRLNTLQTFATLEEALESGLDTEYKGGGPLLPGRRQEITDELALYRHIFAEGKLITDSEFQSWTLNSAPGRQSFFYSYIMLMFILLVYIGVQAGSMLSKEIESGSIKLLIIAPVKRWKMYAAKVLALLSQVLILVLFAFSWNLLWIYLLQGGSGIPGYTGVYLGEVYVLSFLQQAGLDILGLTAKLIFYGLLALMVSSLFRKTALAVGVSIAVAFADFVATLIYYNTPWTYWYRYMPFVNLDLGNIRMSTMVSQFTRFGSSVNNGYNQSLAFSLIYIAVLAALFIWTGMDAFTKRDI